MKIERKKEHERERKGELKETAEKNRNSKRKIQKTQGTERNTHVNITEKGNKDKTREKEEKTHMFLHFT